MTAALATRWCTAAEVADLVGVSHWVVRRAVALERAHSHFEGPKHAGQHFLLEAPARLWREGASLAEQRRACACCCGAVKPPPVVLGRRRSRRTPAPS